MNWVTLIQEIGPYLSIMFFFVWRDFRREERLESCIRDLNDFIQNKLVQLIEKTNEALNRVK